MQVDTMMDIRSAAAGDRAAFARLVDATKQVVTSIALAILRDVRASEDVAQEVYLQAWRDLPTLRRAESFLPWLRQLTRNEALTCVRSRRRYERRHAPWSTEADERGTGAGALDAAISEEERLVLEEALAAMPDDTRDVLTLFYREEQSVRQVAHLLGSSEAAVKKRLERARAALREGVEARFEHAAKKSAAGVSFVAAVVGSLAFAAPTTAKAALVVKAGKSALAAVAPATALAVATIPQGRVEFIAFVVALLAKPALVSACVGSLLVLLLMRPLLATALDARERRELRGLRARALALVVGFHLTVVGSVAGIRWIGDLGAGVGILLAWVGFGVAGGVLFSHSLPIVLARRRQIERETDPVAFAAAQRRRRRRSYIVLAAAVGALVGAWELIVQRV